MFCENCGNKLKEGADVCLNCGKQVKKENSNDNENYERNYNMNHYGNGFLYQQIPSEYKPISMWGYFGYEILFAIPIIGWLLLLIFALGGTSNVNLKNFARSYFCLLIIIVIIFLIVAAVGVGTYSSL